MVDMTVYYLTGMCLSNCRHERLSVLNYYFENMLNCSGINKHRPKCVNKGHFSVVPLAMPNNVGLKFFLPLFRHYRNRVSLYLQMLPVMPVPYFWCAFSIVFFF